MIEKYFTQFFALIERCAIALESIAANGINTAAPVAPVPEKAEVPDAQTADETEGKKSRGRGRGRNIAATPETEKAEPAATDSTAGAAPTGRGRRTPAAAASESTDGPKARRGRTSKPAAPAEETAEQKELRAQIFELAELAGDEPECADELRDELKRLGVTMVNEIDADQLETVFENINTIIDKYFE